VVRELVQRRSLNLRDCGFESRLRHSANKWVDWTWESKLSVKQSLLDEQWRFDSFSAHWHFVPSASLSHDVVELVDTRRSERRAIEA
jgi:hypothetical protein